MLINFYKLFEEFFEDKEKIKEKLINYTRAGYLYKVINSILISKPEPFVNEIYNNHLICQSLFKHSYSKSVSNIIQTLLVTI